MMSCPECHAGVYRDIVCGFRHIGMEGAVHNHTSVDNNGLEIILFPFAVPVLSLHKLRPARKHHIHRYCRDCLVDRFLTVQSRRDIRRHGRSVFRRFETLESTVGELGCEQIEGVRTGRIRRYFYLIVIVHFYIQICKSNISTKLQ